MTDFDAVIFDLDGVITQTALVHSSAWKKMFDDYLRYREKEFGEPFREFSHTGDYLRFVDGKPRYKGVASFLESRDIKIPYGNPEDLVESETVCGLGNRKNEFFNKVLNSEGVRVYETTVDLIMKLKQEGIRIGVASSSKNCKPVLEAAGLLDLFETRIDGVVSAERGLQGKPEPDIFTTACDELGIKYHRAVVVEDAVSGVQAGSRGNFGLVIGVARENNIRELFVGGADIVVTDLGEITVEKINAWFKDGLDDSCWSLTYHDYDPEKERSREALMTVGNGYFGTRGALEESAANRVNYPATYIAGLYNRLVSRLGERDVENEDFVNIPNWLPVTFRIGDSEWFGFTPDPSSSIERIYRFLNFRNGELHREIIVTDDKGRRTLIRSSRFASMSDPHRAGIRYTVKPLNYSSQITLSSELNGDHINAGVERYSQLNQKHIEPLSERTEGNTGFLVVKTTRSDVKIALATRYSLLAPDGLTVEKPLAETGKGWVRSSYTLDLEEGREVTIEKLVTLFTSKDKDVDDPLNEARQSLNLFAGYSDELAKSRKTWEDIWNTIDIRIEGDRLAQKLVRLHLFHSMVTASPHHIHLDAGIPPRGLHGEAYRGHIFWDELYILPLYNIHFPEVVRSVLLYRYRRLDKAREYAREYGYSGAMFPWQSGSDGREETQVMHLNPVSGEWGDDYSSLQRHVSLAIAFNIWNYFNSTGDKEFMIFYGAEMFLEICRFWVSKAEWDEKEKRFHIGKVMGPDEFHEKYPGSAEGGLKDNAYTNIMVCWAINKAFRIVESFCPDERQIIFNKIRLTNSEIIRWKKIVKSLALEISAGGIIAQFRGYFDLPELDWEHYQKKYQDIHRMDRILKSEGKLPDDYKVAKQADMLMCFYLLQPREVADIVKNLGYEIPQDFQERNFSYYIERTSHGSTLSRLVHASLAYKMGNYSLGWDLYMQALQSDLVDIQGGTTGEGIHCGVMTGTVYSVLNTFCGLNLSNEIPEICPDLPDHWERVHFRFYFRNTGFNVVITRDKIELSAQKDGDEKIMIHICGQEYELKKDRQIVLNRIKKN
ncbi:MAG: HAD-IA family hydrolase [Bacteroidales bacterium]|nr:MAG: HAD-IA family hydrolase [Bacteroidales bacterium]